MINNITFDNLMDSPVRKIRARVELRSGSTYDTFIGSYSSKGKLKSFSIERVGEESKFFGFGICQKLNIKFVDKDRKLTNMLPGYNFRIYLQNENDELRILPLFYITETHRDEKTNELSVTAYDGIYNAAAHTWSEVKVKYPATLETITRQVCKVVGLPVDLGEEKSFNLPFYTAPNFSGSETLREVLTRIAEATQTIYYVNSSNVLRFTRLDKDAKAVETIGKEKYFELKSGDNKRLATITHVTELGDNVTASSSFNGSTQYVRNNGFWELREDIGALVDNALAAVAGLTINQFDCSWRGNALTEPGDKIELITKDGAAVYSFILNDKIEYNGGLTQKTSWHYEKEEEIESNPSSLGDKLNQTFARVDKVNNKIDILAKDTDDKLASLNITTENIKAQVKQNTDNEKAHSESISELQQTSKEVNLRISSIETSKETDLENINSQLTTLTNSINAAVTSEDLTIAIKEERAKGATKIQTETGFTFDDEGLTVSKSDREMKTQITENGMTVKKNNEAVLTANNNGVDAVNLHATTYLIIGNNSRFEDMGNNRTGCFYIGG